MADSNLSDVQLTGYFPGVIGKITELHAVYYAENWELDLSFETQVARELSDFHVNFQEDRDGLWVATIDGVFAGSVSVDGNQAPEEGARLRWFIVPAQFQGRGIGFILLKETIDFCREVGHKRIFLWTFEGLEVARRLYEQAGFRLSEEHPASQWGRKINEQLFVLNLG